MLLLVLQGIQEQAGRRWQWSMVLIALFFFSPAGPRVFRRGSMFSESSEKRRPPHGLHSCTYAYNYQNSITML